MRKVVNHKFLETIPESAVPITNADGEPACSLNIEETGVFLYFKCFCSKEKRKKKIVKLCVADFVKQGWNCLPESQKAVLRLYMSTQN